MAEIKSYLIDMDGVLISGQVPIPGAIQFIEKLKSKKSKYLVLTNNSIFTPRDLAHRLQTMGLDIKPDVIFYLSHGHSSLPEEPKT
jgi:NagD protein